MAVRLSTSHVPDLLLHSDIRVLAPAGGGDPMVEGATPWGRKVLRCRLTRLLARTTVQFLTSVAVGMLAGWAVTALVVLVS